MFGLSIGEIALICVVALIILGPKKLPELAKGLGKGIKDFQKALRDGGSDDDESKVQKINQPSSQDQFSNKVAGQNDSESQNIGQEVNSKTKS